MSRQVILAVLLVLVAFTQTPAFDNLHKATSACRLEFRSECDNVCLTCHTPPGPAGAGIPTPWNPRGLTPNEVYADGDKETAPSDWPAQLESDVKICIECHMNYKGDNNHPVDVPYDASELSAQLVRNPQGPKLLCAAKDGPCKMQCSTCHDVHESNSALLRMGNRGSALCIACHRK